MQIFRCPACGDPLYFDNLTCGCGTEVAFDPDAQAMVAADAPCANRGQIDCNWVTDGGDDGLCRSCAMTGTVPDLTAEGNLALWAKAEAAKRYMLAGLARWGWFGPGDPGGRPVFRMLSEETRTGPAKITMGHADGEITINVTEASEAVLSRRQEELGELYRTMLGHMRHETAHFLHIRLSEDPGFVKGFRDLFGDERADYGEALQRHYEGPKPADDDFVTSYATAHPHEDWAETLAHLMHLTDMLDSGSAAGLTLPGGPPPGTDAYAIADTDRLVTDAVALSIAANHVNRAMDLPDLYPFVLGEGVRRKLAFAHGHLRETAHGMRGAAA